MHAKELKTFIKFLFQYFMWKNRGHAACGCRFKANLVNDAFVQELEKYVPREGYG